MTADHGYRPLPEYNPDGAGEKDGKARASSRTDAAMTPLLDQEFDLDSLTVLRAAVADHAARAGLGPRRVRDVVLAVNELAANAVCHDNGHGRLLMLAQDRTLRCQVSDDGPPPPGAPRAADTHACRNAPWLGGHGLRLASLLADEMSLHTGPRGAVATVTFQLG